MSSATIDWLEAYRFSGTIRGYREGELYFPGSPVLSIEAPFAEAVLLETLALSVLNYDSAVASAAARMVSAAGGRPLAEMGSRRTGGASARSPPPAPPTSPGSPRPATSRPGARWGIPTMGTAAHAFTLLFDTEEDAFRAQVAAMGAGHDPSRRHLRHPDGGRRPPCASPDPRSARCGSTPATSPSHPAGARPARRARGDDDPHHGDERPRRVRDRRAGGCAGRLVRRRHLARDRFRASPPPAWSTSSSPTTTRTAPGSRWRRGRRRRPPSAGASAGALPPRRGRDPRRASWSKPRRRREAGQGTHRPISRSTARRSPSSSAHPG